MVTNAEHIFKKYIGLSKGRIFCLLLYLLDKIYFISYIHARFMVANMKAFSLMSP